MEYAVDIVYDLVKKLDPKVQEPVLFERDGMLFIVSKGAVGITCYNSSPAEGDVDGVVRRETPRDWRDGLKGRAIFTPEEAPYFNLLSCQNQRTNRAWDKFCLEGLFDLPEKLPHDGKVRVIHHESKDNSRTVNNYCSFNMTSSERFEENVEVDVAEARTVDEKRYLAAARKAEVLSRKSMIEMDVWKSNNAKHGDSLVITPDVLVSFPRSVQLVRVYHGPETTDRTPIGSSWHVNDQLDTDRFYAFQLYGEPVDKPPFGIELTMNGSKESGVDSEQIISHQAQRMDRVKEQL